jgi:uncharacterized membrane protein YsdA (DUF1294 family)
VGKVPLALPMLYIVCSAFTFIAYAKDKGYSQTGEWRISENELHMMELVFGWPGALIAQEEIRHKTQKDGFLLKFKLAAVANLALVGFYLNLRGVI